MRRAQTEAYGARVKSGFVKSRTRRAGFAAPSIKCCMDRPCGVDCPPMEPRRGRSEITPENDTGLNESRRQQAVELDPGEILNVLIGFSPGIVQLGEF
jgi:hypothetical protein